MKHKMGLGLIGMMLTLSLIAVGCAAATNAATPDLNGSSWVLQDLPGHALVPDSEITLTFEGEQIHGSAGCNSYFGAVEINGATLRFGPPASTMMYCEGLMDQEMAYLAMLETVTTFQVEGNTLTLFSSESKPLAVFITIAK
ncbi:MAG: META domain-containing protein [Anaerolineae bacterium]|nr:META domain-containing protein [Anaerolineae bacterium]